MPGRLLVTMAGPVAGERAQHCDNNHALRERGLYGRGVLPLDRWRVVPTLFWCQWPLSYQGLYRAPSLDMWRIVPTMFGASAR
jgi:hypothetical protein